jgi:hypothetical protein
MLSDNECRYHPHARIGQHPHLQITSSVHLLLHKAFIDKNRTQWLSVQQYCFIFERSRVRIPAWSSAIFVVYLSPSKRSRYSDWLRVGRPRVRSSNPGSGKIFSPFHVVQTGSGAHPASYPMGTGGSFTGGKAVRS